MDDDDLVASSDSDASDLYADAPLWIVIVTPILAIIGLGIAIYLTIVHFEGTKYLVCNNSQFNCIKVTTSGESRFLGIPVVFLGLFQYTAMTGLCSPWAWHARHREVHIARLAFATVGMGFILWLIAAELLIVKSICEWCSGVHLVTFALFVIIVLTVPKMLGWTGQFDE
ncbi:MAG TPA: vitamin K epoxide reductase family protein [Acidimicrobiales bacterium]